MPVVAKAEGYVAYYVVETGKGEWSSVSIFNTEEQAEGSNRMAAEWVQTNVPGSGPPHMPTGRLLIKK